MVIDSSLADVIRPGTTQGLDFIIPDELRKRTGISPNSNSVLKFALQEMLCNALDKDSTEIGVSIQVEGDFFVLTVIDNGSKKLSLDDLKLILNFENKASSKRGILRVSRGYLGNALKCIFGYSYALAEAKGLAPPPISIRSGPSEYQIKLKPNRVNAVIENEVTPLEISDRGFTWLTVRFPKTENLNAYPLLDVVFATSIVNPTRRIIYDLFGKKGTLGSAEKNMPIRSETSVLWYNQKQFESLLEDFVRARPETQLKEFIELFRGLTAKKIIREILQELNAANQ